MSIQADPIRSRQLTQVADYLTAQPDGRPLKWSVIAAETGIPMNPHGRKLVRRALYRIHRPYIAHKGVGVQLSDPETALPILGKKFTSIDNAVKRADRTQKDISMRHLHQLDPDKQQRLLMMASFFGAVRTIAANYRMQKARKPSLRVVPALPVPRDRAEDARALIDRLAANRITLSLEGGRLRAKYKLGQYTEALRSEVEDLEPELITILQKGSRKS